MTLPHSGQVRTSRTGSSWLRRVRSRWDSSALRTWRTVVGALVLLVLVGVAGGQVLGHLLAAGIEDLLQQITLDQPG
jgi:hypothetical protein